MPVSQKALSGAGLTHQASRAVRVAVALAAVSVAAPAWAVPEATPPGAAVAAVSPAEVSRLQALVLTGEKTPTAAAAGVQAATDLGRLYHAQGDRNSAETAWHRGLALFAKAGLPADGGPAAAAAAEARYRLVEPEALRLLTTPLTLDATLPPARQLVDLQKRLMDWQLAATGIAGARTTSGVRGACAAIEDLKAPVWSRQAAVLLAKVLAQPAQALAALVVPPGTPPAAEAAHRDVWLVRAKTLRDEGFAALERAWKQAEREGNRDETADRVRKALHGYDPAQYPLAEAVTADTAAEPPGRAEAARLAGLAQQADKPTLKVMYLRKAVKLDPTHEQWQAMLRSAEAELARER